MSFHSNSNLHFEIRTETGEVFAEKCRDSFGGFVNMTKRVAARFGVERIKATNEDGTAWAAGDLAFTVTRVQKL